MASSPAEPESKVGFALQEAAVCWEQAFEALARGDLDQVDALLAIAAEHVAAAGDGSGDTPAEALLRQTALGAFGRLHHGMLAGLDGLRGELGRIRQGARALRGYGSAAGGPPPRLHPGP
ncbi:MAG: hypothetical protein KF830_05900 [Planctomycetes bacterium]|nr:hypothetical protein [Planctomycetota bacterium]